MKVYLSLLLLLSLENAGGQYKFTEAVIYSKNYKIPYSNETLSAFVRPEQFYLITFFNEHVSITITKPDENSDEKQVSKTLQNPSSFKFANLDSLFAVEKSGLCESYYKSAFPIIELLKTNRDTIIQSLHCLIAYHISAIGDTNFFYLSKQMPKSAGILIGRNIQECIIGFKSSNMTIFPERFIKKLDLGYAFDLHYENIDGKILNPDNLIEGKYAEIRTGKEFPPFYAKDINNRIINNNSLKKQDYAVFVILKNLVSCKNYDTRFTNFYESQRTQNEELLSALSDLVKEKHVVGYVITDDYYEQVKNLAWGNNLQIISNAAAWKETMQLYEGPLIIVVKKNIIISKLSPFDFKEESFYQGLKRRISE